MVDTQSKIALVTGANKGIGKEITRQLPVATDHGRKPFSDAVETLGPADLTHAGLVFVSIGSSVYYVENGVFNWAGAARLPDPIYQQGARAKFEELVQSSP